jgi:transposase-like protein
VIALVVFWRLRYKLSLRDLLEMFLIRGIEFSYETVRDWETKLTPFRPASFGEARGVIYSELAQIRGIGRESAVKLVQRERWRRQPGNDRSVRVLVPAEWQKPTKIGEGIPEGFGEFASLVSGLHDTVAFVRERAEAADRRTDQAEARADQAEATRLAAEARADPADAALTGERTRADALRDRIEALQVQLADAQTATTQANATAQSTVEAAELLRPANAERKARGLSRGSGQRGGGVSCPRCRSVLRLLRVMHATERRPTRQATPCQAAGQGAAPGTALAARHQLTPLQGSGGARYRNPQGSPGGQGFRRSS